MWLSCAIVTIPNVALLEREADLGRLDASWIAARRGRGAMVVVHGDPGAGKTSLIRTFVDTDLGDAAVLWGACDPLPTPRPLGPLHDVAHALDDASRAALDEAEQSHEIFAAVFEHIRRQPTVLVIDDLHWSDQGTVDLLRYLLRRIGSTRSMVVIGLRPDELSIDHPTRALLGDVARSSDATSITLRPLSREAIVELADGRTVDAARIEQLTGGNPFFVTAMLEHDGDELPASVRDAILARTTDLDPDAWEVVHLLACAPEAIADHLLAGLGIGLPPLRALDQAGLIRRGSRGVEFRHDLCRLAVASTIPPGGEVGLHQRMVIALEQTAAPDPSVLTHHAVGAGDPVRVLRYAPEAARIAARSGARRQSAALLQLALDRGALAPPQRQAELLEWLAEEYYLIDQLELAIASSDRAMELRQRVGDLAGVSVNHHALSVYHWYNADRDVAERHAGDAITVFDGDDVPVADVPLGHGYAMQAFLAMHTGALDVATELISTASAIGARSGDHPLTVRTGLIDGICRMASGDPSGRQSVLSILEAPDAAFDEIYSSGWSNLTALEIEQRRLTDAAAMLDVSLPLTVERELPICRVWQLGTRGRMRMMTGDWVQAAADADDVLSGPSAPLAQTWPRIVRGLVALRRTGDGNADLDAAWALATRYREPMRLLPAASALVEQAWLTGREDARVGACRRLLAASARPGLEWSFGELATWLHRLDPATDVSPAIGCAAEPYRLELTGDPAAAAARWAELASRTSRRSPSPRRAMTTTPAPPSTCSTGWAPTRSRRRSASTCAPAASPRCRRAAGHRRGPTLPASPAARSRSSGCSTRA
jgi:hypothetical protein